MNERRTNFLKVFLIEAGPSAELLTAFVIGLLVVGLASNLLYDLVTTPFAVLETWWQPVLAIGIGTGLAYLFYWLDRRHGSRMTLTFDERLSPPGHKGIIWLLGPGNLEHLSVALAHHRSRGGAQECWLLMQGDNAAVRDAFAELTKTVHDGEGHTRLHPVYLDQVDVQHTYRAVRSIYERAAYEEGLTAEQVIADITGGFKPMTAGMVLGTLAAGRATLEYVESERNEEGNPKPGSAHVVWVDVNFFRGEAGGDDTGGMADS